MQGHLVGNAEVKFGRVGVAEDDQSAVAIAVDDGVDCGVARLGQCDGRAV